MWDDLRWLYLSPRGALNRVTFILGWLFPVTLEGLALWQMVQAPENSGRLVLWFLAFVVISILGVIGMVMMAIKRLRALNWPLFFAALMLVPAVSPFLLILLSVARSALPGGNDNRRH